MVRMPAGNYMDHYKVEFLERCDAAAYDAGHLFPEFAACEAAEESGFGTSKLAVAGNNLFGCKQHSTPIYQTIEIPTWEHLPIAEVQRLVAAGLALALGKVSADGTHQDVKINAHWVKYPGWRESFLDRMATLHRLAAKYPDYAAALKATTGDQFVRLVSKTWSSDPHRADKVLDIHRQWKGC